MNNKKKSDIYVHQFIIFCSDHYNPLGVIRSLGEEGIRPIVILNISSREPRFITKSKYPKKIHMVNSIEEGLKVLIDIYGNEKNKPFVYSCSDDVCQLFDKNYNRLIDSFYFFHGKEAGIVSQYLDKSVINSIAEKNGCNVLKNEILDKGTLPSALKYPVITKALSSTLYAWKDEMHICQNKDELRSAWKEIRSDRLLVQEYIKKENELCLDGFSFNDGNDVYIPYYTNYIRHSDLSYGGYMLLKPFDQNEKVYLQIKSILKEIGFTGIFSAEFLIDDKGNNWFLEINFRNSTWSYAFTYGGVNMPFLWAEATINGDFTKPKSLMTEFKAMSEYEDYEMSVLSGMITLKGWKKDYDSADVHFLSNPKDPKPWNVHRFIRNLYIKKFIRFWVHLFGKKFME